MSYSFPQIQSSYVQLEQLIRTIVAHTSRDPALLVTTRCTISSTNARTGTHDTVLGGGR